MSRLPSISSIMSPPEPKPLECFDRSVAQAHKSLQQSASHDTPKIKELRSQDAKNNSLQVPLSPPESPWRKQDENMEDMKEACSLREAKTSQKDPVLYPGVSRDVVNGSLFQEISDDDPRGRLVDQHMRSSFVVPKSRGTSSWRYQMPDKKDYMLMVDFVSRINPTFNRNPAAYLKRTREEYDKKGPHSKRVRRDSGSIRSMQGLDQRNHIFQQRAIQQPKQTVRTPVSRSHNSPEGISTLHVKRDATAAKRMPPPKKQEHSSHDFNAIPNYCPPLSTLPSQPKALSVDWQGNPLDLSNDPDRNLLHEAELYLASRLRLTCALYLCVKRRIFVGRVNNFIKGKKFTKTDAQGCGHIDVNKSSKIWTAYEKVGWFDRRHFEHAINEVSQSIHRYDPALQCIVDTSKAAGS